MGSSFCCSRELCCSDPFSQQEKKLNQLNEQSNYSSTVIKLRRNGLSGLLYEPYFTESPNHKNKSQAQQQENLKKRKDYVNRIQQWKAQFVFSVDIPFDARQLSFSQRRFVGFRCKFEFDKKRVLVASNNEITVLGYDQLERPFELYRGILRNDNQIQTNKKSGLISSLNEEILLASFLEEQIPSFIFTAQQEERNERIEFRILKLKKNKHIYVDNEELDIQKFSNMQNVTNSLVNHIKLGEFETQSKRMYDNIQVTPKSHIQLFKNPGFKKFRKQQKSQMHSLNNSKLDNSVQDHSNSTFHQQPEEGYMNVNYSNQPPKQTFREVKSFKAKRDRVQRLDLTETTNFWNHSSEMQLPFVIEEYGNMVLQGCLSKVQLFHSNNGNYLFTFERHKKQITIYIIKACVSGQVKNAELKQYKCPKISNFRMARKCTLNLDYQPECLDLYADYFLLKYQTPYPYIDLFERNGNFHDRFDIQKTLQAQYGLQLLSIKQAIFPRMKWSDRRMEEFDKENRLQLLKKFLVVGFCQPKGDVGNGVADTPDKSSKSLNQTKLFMMLYNLQKHQSDRLKLINLRDAEIACMNYGPFDNGYLLLGLTNGILLGVNLHEMEIILQEQVFDDCAIKDIVFEPTNLVFLTSANKELVAMNLVKKEMHYVYLELSKKQYCTVTVPNTTNNNSFEESPANKKTYRAGNGFENDGVEDEVCFRRITGENGRSNLRICC